MNTPDRNENVDTPAEKPAAPRRLLRSRSDRVIAGVCGGLGAYFGIDPVIFRIALVALTLIGGVGILLYAAAALLVPLQPDAEQGGAPVVRRGPLAILGVSVLVLAVGGLLAGSGLFVGWALVPLVFVALVALLVWWLVSGEGPRGSGRDVARRIALGIGVIALCSLIAVAGAWAAAAGGGVAAAILVIAAGATLIVASLFGRGRWLILPVLSLALPVALVSAADVDLHGGIGEREYRPQAAAQIQQRYKLGMGRLVVDLRDTQLPPGDRPLALEVGIGEALLLVPEDVCVATKAKLGIGGVQVFDRQNGGVDVDWRDAPSAPRGVTRLLVDADVGLGSFEVRHHDYDRRSRGPFFDGGDDGAGNAACSRAPASRTQTRAPQ